MPPAPKRTSRWERGLKRADDFIIPAKLAPEVLSPGAGIQSLFQLFDFYSLIADVAQMRSVVLAADLPMNRDTWARRYLKAEKISSLAPKEMLDKRTGIFYTLN